MKGVRLNKQTIDAATYHGNGRKRSKSSPQPARGKIPPETGSRPGRPRR